MDCNAKEGSPLFLYGTVVLRGRRCLLISQRWKDTFYFFNWEEVASILSTVGEQ